MSNQNPSKAGLRLAEKILAHEVYTNNIARDADIKRVSEIIEDAYKPVVKALESAKDSIMHKVKTSIGVIESPDVMAGCNNSDCLACQIADALERVK